MRLVFVLPSTVGHSRRLRSLLQRQWSQSKWSMEIRRLPPQSRPETITFSRLPAALLDPKSLRNFLLLDLILRLPALRPERPGLLTHTTLSPHIPKHQTALFPTFLARLQLFVHQPSYVRVSSPFGIKHLLDIFPTLSPPKTVLEEYSTFSCDWDVLRLVPSSHTSLNVHSCRTSFRQARRGSVCFRCRVARRDCRAAA